MKKLIVVIVMFLTGLFFVLPIPAHALFNTYTVNSGTWDPTNPANGVTIYDKGPRHKLTLTATGDSSNNASITISSFGMLDIAGYASVIVNPDDTNVPTVGYDLSVTNGEGIDIIKGGQGTDLSTTLTTDIYLDLTHVSDSMTILFTGIGDGNQAEITIIFDYYKER